MVTVPTYSKDVSARGVATTARRGPGSEAFGGDVGRALGGLGQSLDAAAGVAEKIVDMRAESAAREAAIQAGSRVREELWGEQGLMRQDGRKFIDAADPTRERLKALQQEFGAKGRNGFEQRMIDDALRREIEPALGQIDRSYGKAVVDENRSTTAARTANVIDMGVKGFADDTQHGVDKQALQDAFDDEADAYGYDPETRLLKERQTFTQFYVNGIAAALGADDTATAEKRFEEAVGRGLLTGQAQAQVGEKIANAKNTVMAEQFGMDIETTGGIPTTDGVDFAPPLSVLPPPSSTYGPRKHPIDGVVKPHTGIDYPVPEGTPVLASAPGKVVEVANRGGYGTMVRVDHGGGTETWYAHLSAADVKVGDFVKQGQKLAASGNSGKSTGPHLHYEVRHGGQPADPNKPVARVELTLENLKSVALARAGGDPVLFKKLFAEGAAALQRKEATKRDREEKLVDEAWKYAEKATAESQIPRSVWNALKPQQRDAFRAQIKQNVQGDDVETDLTHYGALMTMLSDRPKDFRNYEFETDNNLSKAEKKWFINQRTQLRAGKEADARSSLEVTNRVAAIVMPSAFKAEDQDAFKGALFRAVSMAEQGGTKLDEKTIMDMAGRLTVEVALTGKGTLGKKAPLYKLSPGARGADVVNFQDIPDVTRNRLVNDFKRANPGATPTKAQVAEAYVSLRARGLVQ